MLLRYLLISPVFFLGTIIAFVVGVTVHEYAHARAAFQLGDDLPYTQGRVTLNPRSHIDPYGLLLFALVGFGWGRPVLVNPYRFYPNEQRGIFLTKLAGPVSNFAMALVAGILVRILVGLGLTDGAFGFITALVGVFVYYNVLLGVFNLIPAPPLDGWEIMLGLLPRQQSYELRMREQQFAMALPIILIVIILVGALTPFLSLFFWLFTGTTLGALL